MYDKNLPETIQNMFGTIAKRYDRTNAILSFGLHRYWNRSLVKGVAQNEGSWLDLCCGTGDIAYTYLKGQRTPKQALLVDFCPEMLTCAEEKARKLNLEHHQLSFIQADVQELPIENEAVSVATMAYGIRNVKDPLKCFREVERVLKQGGVFGVLELTQPSNPIMRWGHRVYLRTVLPLLGKWLTDNQEAYQYLCNSIQGFIPPSALEGMLLQAGFKRVTRHPMTFGSATILIGHKLDLRASDESSIGNKSS